MSLYRIYIRIFRDLSTYLQKVAMYISIYVNYLLISLIKEY